MDEQLSALFPLRFCVVPGLACRANNFARGVYIWLSFSFFPGVKKDYEILLVMFYVWQRTPRINRKVFLPLNGNKVTFRAFPLFKL